MNDFEDAISRLGRDPSAPIHFHRALIDVNDTVAFAKKILLTNKVQNFTASDVVNLTRLIIQREQALNLRGQEDL